MPTFKTADVSDRHGSRARHCTMQFRQFGKVRLFSGRIETIQSAEDGGLALARLKLAGNGKVLVLDGGGSLRLALVGDKMARLAIANGWSGLVVHGAIRDVAEIDDLDIGILALGTIPARGSIQGTGKHNVPVTFGGVEFQPGHYVCCDADGVVVTDHEPDA